MAPANPQRLAEERSLAFHREIARRLRDDASLIEAARGRIARWVSEGTMARRYADAWLELLDQPVSELREALVDSGERGRALRQCSPFAGALDPRTRWRIHRSVNESRSSR